MGAPIDQRFSFLKVALAADVNYETLKRWALRGHLVMREEDRESMGQGGRRLLSFHTTMQALVMADLASRGVPLADASAAGARFGHAGDEDREPGGLFMKASTVVAYNADSPVKARILKVSKNDTFLTVLGKTWPNNASRVTGADVVNMQPLLLNCASALEMDPAWIIETLED